MELRYNGERLTMAIRAMVVMIIAEVVGIFQALYSIKVIGDIESGNYIDSEIDSFDMISMTFGIFFLAVFIITIILFLMWFRRAYYNVAQFALTAPRFTEGWASGAWFVPILSLFRPVQIMREIWLETSAYLREKSPFIPPSNIQSIISLWWGLWIVGNIIGNISWRLPSETIEEMRIGYYFDIASSIFLIPAGIFIIKIMKEYGKLEDELDLVQNVEGESDSIFY